MQTAQTSNFNDRTFLIAETMNEGTVRVRIKDIVVVRRCMNGKASIQVLNQVYLLNEPFDDVVALLF